MVCFVIYDEQWIFKHRATIQYAIDPFQEVLQNLVVLLDDEQERLSAGGNAELSCDGQVEIAFFVPCRDVVGSYGRIGVYFADADGIDAGSTRIVARGRF